MSKRASTAPQGRRIYLKGLGTQSQKRVGAFIWTSPVLNRRKAPTIFQTYAQQTLRVAARFVTLAFPWEYQTAKDLAGRSGYTWKDQLIANFFGNSLEFTDTNGVLWQSRRIMAAEIQQLLDSISSTPGSILVRTDGGWAALYPGTAEYVLTMRGDTGLPDWIAPSGGSGGADLAPASIIQSAVAVVASGTPAVTLGATPTPGHVLIALVSHWSNSIALNAGWSTYAQGPTSTDDAWAILTKLVDSTDTVSQNPSSTNTGWNIAMFEVDGGTANNILGYNANAPSSGLTCVQHSAAPQDDTLLIGMAYAQERTAPTIAFSGSTVTPLGAASNATGGSGGPRAMQAWSAPATPAGAFDLTTTFGSTGKNGMLLLVIGPHVVPAP